MLENHINDKQQLKLPKTQFLIWICSVLLYVLSHWYNFGFFRGGLLMLGILPAYSVSFMVISLLALKYSIISPKINLSLMFGHITFFLSTLLPDINLRKEESFVFFNIIHITNDSFTMLGMLFALLMAITNIVLQIVLIVLVHRVKKNFKNNKP